MKPIFSILASALALGLAMQAKAQTLQAIYTFNTNGPANSTNGANPRAGLTLAPDHNLYGTTEFGGTNDNGTLYRVSTTGQLATLHSFNAQVSGSGGNGLVWYTNSDGADPFAGLTLAGDGNLYGVAPSGGTGGGGTIFQLTTNGDFIALYAFSPDGDLGYDAGQNPISTLALGSDGNLYGGTWGGGEGFGNIYSYSLTGGFSVVYGIPLGEPTPPPIRFPYLTGASNGVIYGAASYGFTNGTDYGDGCVFKLDGSGLDPLYYFSGANDGGMPLAAPTLGPDGNYYGTTSAGGTNGFGTIYRIAPDGSNFTSLYSFTNGTDGASPQAALLVGVDGQLYGTTTSGGAYGDGTVFRISTNGTFTALASFNGTNGADPLSGLVLGPDGNYYGTTYSGGNGYGVIYQLIIWSPKILGIAPAAGPSMILTLSDLPGSTNRLFSTANLLSPFAQWQLVGTGIAATNGLFQLTDPNISGHPAKFYRLISP